MQILCARRLRSEKLRPDALKKSLTQQTSLASPKVSVVMITYNHGKFIAQAIESVLMQEADFQVELVIGEDCSTDDTRKIVQEYAARYPQIIRALLPEQNMGAQKNAFAVFSACRGEYIAILEGDDYWTDSTKLSRQVDLMDSNPEISFCFHPIIEFDESHGRETVVFPAEDPRNVKDLVEELIRWNFIPSNSRLLRRSKIPVFDNHFQDLKLGDWPTSIMMSLNGKIGYLPQKMAVYRRHSNSTWSSKGQDYRDLETYKMFVYLYRKQFRSYGPSIARSALTFSRLVMGHRHSQRLRPNISLAITSLKVAYGINLFEMMVQVKWLLLLYSASAKRTLV